MASPNLYPNAFAASGPDIVARVGNLLSGAVYWVSSLTGNDANAGTEPELPKATFASAYTAAAAGDVILFAAGHSEVVSVAATLSKDIAAVSLGVGTQRARFTSAVAGAMWTVTGDFSRFVSLYFPASTAATTSRINVTTAAGTKFFGCYFENGANDTTDCVVLSDNECVVESCDFVATASRPSRGLNIGNVNNTTVKDCLFDGGAYGWTNPALGVTAAATRVYMENIRLANKSDVVFTTTGTSYRLFGVRPIDNTGSRIVIAA